MKFECSRVKAVEKLDNFIQKNLHEYSKLRNFDFGPEKRSNVERFINYHKKKLRS